MLPACHATPHREEGFPRALKRAVSLAVLSPSSHNCQPWGVARATTAGARAAAAAYLGRCEGDREGTGDSDEGDSTEYLALALDHRRELVALPAYGIEMRVSCGAYWHMLLRSLAAQGWIPARVRVPSDEGRIRFGQSWPAEWSLLCVAALRRGTTSGERFDELHATARDRRTHRGAYHKESLNAGLLDTLEQTTTVTWEGKPDAVAVQHHTDASHLGAFATFLARNAGRDYSHPQAWRETYSYLRWTPAQAAAQRDGFTPRQLFGPLTPGRLLAKRMALAPDVMRLLCHVGYQHRLAGGLAAAVREHTPALVTMGFHENRPDLAALLLGGARLADYWLRAAAAGLALHPLSVVVQHDDLRRSLRPLLGLRGRPFFVSRLGRPLTGTPRTSRCTDAAAYRAL